MPAVIYAEGERVASMKSNEILSLEFPAPASGSGVRAVFQATGAVRWP